MRKRAVALSLLLVHMLAQPVYAWDAVGHEVIARIAWANLTPRTRAAAVALLSNGPPGAGLAELYPTRGTLAVRRRTFFVEASTWPDLVRSDSYPARRAKYHHSGWHFVNQFFEETPQGPRERTDLPAAAVTIVTRLGDLERSVVDLSRPSAARAVDLAWILHLAGDVHQPLHATARVSSADPAGDRGGNDFCLSGGRTRCDSGPNLHAYWDGAIRRAYRRKAGEAEHVYVERIAQAIMQRHPKSEFAGRLDPGRYDAWAREGLATAEAEVYRTPRGRAPSAAYADRVTGLAEREAALAGYRLAELLNRTIGGEPGTPP